MGGVGKTQLAIEFCYRHFAAAASAEASGHSTGPIAYGLVIWLRAESVEARAADLRSLAIDSGIGVQGLGNEEVEAQVRSRLFRTRTPWLLVLDKCAASPFEHAIFLSPPFRLHADLLLTARLFDSPLDAA